MPDKLMAHDLPRLAITGATGFVGRCLLKTCSDHGVPVAALTRQTQATAEGIRWVQGDLSDLASLEDLVTGADVVLHMAGATKALKPQGFTCINTKGTVDLAETCIKAGVGQFVFLSSLAATRPFVSPYAASKAAAETALDALGTAMDITTLRAPAVLGPYDSATRALFSTLAKGRLPVPGGVARDARFSILDVNDLAKLLVAVALNPKTFPPLFAPYGHESVAWPDITAAATRVLQREVKEMVIPMPVLRSVAWLSDGLAQLRRKPEVFSRDKLREMQAGDWIATSPIDKPVSMDDTLRTCLAPFITLPTP